MAIRCAKVPESDKHASTVNPGKVHIKVCLAIQKESAIHHSLFTLPVALSEEEPAKRSIIHRHDRVTV